MILKVVIDDQLLDLNVPESFLEQAEDFFAKMDADMDQGWQMSRDWVDNPDLEQRCQIVGDKMLTAMHNDNRKLLVLLAAYMLNRVPGIKGIRIDTNGEMMESELVMK